jgi:polyhydroxybutyrate depolymerase
MKLRLLALLALTLVSLSPADAAQTFTVGGDRPVTVHLPNQISGAAPLLILLHSASTSGSHLEKYMGIAPLAKKAGVIYIAPDGTLNPYGKRFWNASKSCCNRFKQEVDDVAYLNSLIDQVDAKQPVDPKRIYLIGHSNGAFMSFTFACKTNKIAAIVTIAGAMDDAADCTPSAPLSLLNIHGTADKTIKVAGGVMNDFAYTSAKTTVKKIAAASKCVDPVKQKRDFEPTIKGLETTVFDYTCGSPTHLQYWEIKDGEHRPNLPADFAQQVMDFLLKQHK